MSLAVGSQDSGKGGVSRLVDRSLSIRSSGSGLARPVLFPWADCDNQECGGVFGVSGCGRFLRPAGLRLCEESSPGQLSQGRAISKFCVDCSYPFLQHGQPGALASNETAEAPSSDAEANASFFELTARWACSGCASAEATVSR